MINACRDNEVLDQQFKITLTTRLTEALGKSIVLSRVSRVAGGDINTCFLLESNRGRFFAKTSKHYHAEAMYQAEACGLRTLAKADHCFRIPTPVALGCFEDQQFLVLEALDFSDGQNWSAFGEELVRLHRVSAQSYGWPEDNFIGSTAQINHPSDLWVEFWWQCRLLPQLERAFHNGYRQPLQSYLDPLQHVTQKLLSGYKPLPSLLHGDLWRGNVGFCQDLQPALFDPAPYYGDREADIAMTELFGGFSTEFYSAYQQSWPLDAGYSQRKPLYNLYHLLNHLNLFGAGYLQQCIAMIHNLVGK